MEVRVDDAHTYLLLEEGLSLILQREVVAGLRVPVPLGVRLAKQRFQSYHPLPASISNY
jgi:hypothetical protein